MHFAYPWNFLFLLLMPLVILGISKRNKEALPFPDKSLIDGLPRGRVGRATLFPLAFLLLGLLALITALAGPRWPDVGSRIPTKGIAIGIVLDASGSMAEEDYLWEGEKKTRFEVVKKVFQLFVEGGEGPENREFSGRPTDLISLVVFATQPQTICPLTLNHEVLIDLLDAQEPRKVPTEARTNIGDAIAWGVQSLASAEEGHKVLVLLSDGEHNVPPPALKPRQAAQLAGNLGIPIYVIDAGQALSSKEVVEKDAIINREEAKKILQQVASLTRGRYFEAGDTKTLLEVCQQIDHLEKQKIQTPYYRRYKEGFQWFALGAFLLLAFGYLLRTVWFRQIP